MGKAETEEKKKTDPSGDEGDKHDAKNIIEYAICFLLSDTF